MARPNENIITRQRKKKENIILHHYDRSKYFTEIIWHLQMLVDSRAFVYWGSVYKFEQARIHN